GLTNVRPIEPARILPHQIHLPEVLFEILVSTGFAVINVLPVDLCTNVVEVYTIGQWVAELIRSVPGKLCDVATDVYWSEFVLCNFTHHPTGNGHNLDNDVVRNFASCERKYKPCTGRE